MSLRLEFLLDGGKDMWFGLYRIGAESECCIHPEIRGTINHRPDMRG